MVGLYDTTGMLRFAGSSVEACLEYATLFQIPVGPTSLQSLPEPVGSTIRVRAVSYTHLTLPTTPYV